MGSIKDDVRKKIAKFTENLPKRDSNTGVFL